MRNVINDNKIRKKLRNKIKLVLSFCIIKFQQNMVTVCAAAHQIIISVV